MDIDHNIIKSI